MDPDFLNARQQLESMIREGRSYSGDERNCLFLNTGPSSGGGGRFATASAVSGFDFADDGRSLGLVDWDHDGDLDVWVSNRTGPQVRFLRNNLNGTARFLAVRLQGDGNSVNRDAIGARVELVTGDSELAARNSQVGTAKRPNSDGDGDQFHTPSSKLRSIRTVRAGEGFLGQSSKWLHFGLGDSATIDHVLVRWPGGKTEKIQGLEPDKRYTITQGEGRAVEVTSPARSVDLSPSTLARERVSDVSRSFFVVRLPLPELPITWLGEDSADQGAIRWTAQGSPKLIVLWASWCQPCQEELQELARNRRQVQDAGVDVFVVCVEGPDSERPLSADEVSEKLRRLDWHGHVGIANRESLHKLELLNKTMFARPRPLPLPASFLIDSQARMAALYHGPVQIDQLLADVAALEDDPRARLERAVGFPGRWQKYVISANYHYVAGFFQEAGYRDYATFLNREALRVDPQNATALLRLGRASLDAGQFRQAGNYLQRVINLQLNDPEVNFEAHENLAKAFHARGQLNAAQRHYEAALALRGSPVICNNLGLILANQNKMSQAASYFEKAARLDPDYDEAYANYGAACVELGKSERAVKAFRRALEINPDHAQAHNNLGYQLEQQGDLKEARRHYQRALEVNPDFAAARENLQRLDSTPTKSP